MRVTSPPRVLIADAMSPRAAALFAERGVEVDERPGLDPEALARIVGDYDGLAVRSATKVTAELLARATRLRVVGRAGIGVDNVDVAAASARGVVVMNTPFGNSITTAEHALGLIFALARQIPAADRSTQDGRWEKNRFMGVELFAKTLGLIGCGNIGSIVASRALGLGMKVIAYDPFLTPERAAQLGVEKVELDELLARADIISLHTPLTDSTRNILSAERLAATRRGVLIVNCARGGLVDEGALKRLLDEGHLGGVALDVFAHEPAHEHPLFGTPGFIATPHLGASTTEAQVNVAVQVAEQMSAYLLHGAVENALNMPSVSAEEAPRLMPWMTLAERLGLMVGQLHARELSEIAIEAEGHAADLPMKPLVQAAVAGVLRSFSDTVNMVNAPVIARDRQIAIREVRHDREGDYPALLRIGVDSAEGRMEVAGTLFGRGTPRLVEIDGIRIEADFAPRMLAIVNEDTPGFIGRLGSALGEAEINIGNFHLGRRASGGEAMLLLSVDQPVPPRLQHALQTLPGVRQATTLGFP